MTEASRRQKDLIEKFAASEDDAEKKKLLIEVATIDGSNSFGLYAQGALAGYESNFDEMINKIAEAIKLQPAFPLAHNDLGVAYLWKGDFQRAEREVNEAIKSSPDIPLFHNNMGAVFYQQNRLSEARKAYEKAIELLPEFVLPHYNLGLLFYSRLDMNDEAEKEFRNSIRLSPGFVAAHAFLGLVMLEKEDFDEAEEHFQNALQIAPNLWLTHIGLGALYAAIGDVLEDKVLYEDAIVHLNKAVEYGIMQENQFEASLGPIYGLRGYINGQLEHYREARADFIKAIKINPNDLTNKRNLRRLRDALKDKRAPFIISVFTWILAAASFLTFLVSFWLFHEKSLQEKQFVLMAVGFFVLTVVCLYLPHVTRIKIGAVELEKVTAKTISMHPRFEI